MDVRRSLESTRKEKDLHAQCLAESNFNFLNVL